MPDPIPLRPRRDDTAADVGSLVRLGREEPPPIPEPVFVEPQYPNLPGDYTPDEPA